MRWSKCEIAAPVIGGVGVETCASRRVPAARSILLRLLVRDHFRYQFVCLRADLT